MASPNSLTLYHGSYAEVISPDLAKCRRLKDFGRGFYLTTSFEQASSFAHLSLKKALERSVSGATKEKAWVSRFSIRTDSFAQLSVCVFEDANSDWLRCVAAHRRYRSLSNEVQRLSQYDVLIGKIANDQTNITLALYLDGIFGTVGSPEAEQMCISRLMPERLKDQYCFRTERALACLHFEESETVWM